MNLPLDDALPVRADLGRSRSWFKSERMFRTVTIRYSPQRNFLLRADTLPPENGMTSPDRATYSFSRMARRDERQRTR